MKKLNISIFIILSLLFSLKLYSQETDGIISKYVGAVGGKTAWDSVKTLKYTGYTSVMGMDIPFTQYIKRPGKWMIELIVQGAKIVQAYNGKEGWMINPMMGSSKPQKTEDDITKSFKNNSLIGGRLMNIKEMEYSVDLVGIENIDGKEVTNLKITDKDGEFSNFYIETATNLIYKVSSKVKRMGVEISSETFYSNYKKVNNLLIPLILEQKLTGAQVNEQTITTDKVEVNVNVDDKIFEMPVE